MRIIGPGGAKITYFKQQSENVLKFAVLASTLNFGWSNS